VIEPKTQKMICSNTARCFKEFKLGGVGDCPHGKPHLKIGQHSGIPCQKADPPFRPVGSTVRLYPFSCICVSIESEGGKKALLEYITLLLTGP
jgi:hypothetical protein